MRLPFLLLTVVASALAGCASSPDAPGTHPSPVDREVAAAPVHEEGHAMPEIEGVPARVVTPAASDASEKPLDVATLVNEPALKLMTIALRQGTPLPVHKTPYPVTIQSLVGSGTVIAGNERFPLSPGQVVVLATGVPHSVEPDGTDTMMLLVHHLRQGTPPATGHGH